MNRGEVVGGVHLLSADAIESIAEFVMISRAKL